MAKVPEKNEIKIAIINYCEMKAISRNELAVQAGVSSATLSNIMNDKWESIDDKMWLKIWNHVKGSIVPNLFNTMDFESVITLCDKAKNNNYMAGLIADYGMGKTTALEAYARKENVFYIYYDFNMKPKHFFYELGKKLGFEYDANIYDQVKKCSETLNTLNNPLLIVDEASKLTDAMIMTLHVLRDNTKHNLGILLAGMPYFKSNLIKKANKQKTGISEFLSRIQIWNELEGLRNNEIEFICESYGITDKREISRLKAFKKFRDLDNEILLHNTINR